MIHRGAGLLALLAVPALAAAMPAAPNPAPPAWHEARSAHFRFFTDGSEAETGERVRAFESLHGILRSTSPDLRARLAPGAAPLPTFVYLFGPGGGFRSFSGRPDESGFFVPHPDGGYIALNTDSPQATETAYHEYLHLFLAGAYPGIPLWLNEGMACFYQTLRLDGAKARLGMPPEGSLQVLAAGGPYPAEGLLALDPASPDYLRGPQRPRVYATVWLLASWLMTTGEERRARLGAFLDLLRAGRSRKEAFDRALGWTPRDLDRELAAYLALLQGTKRIQTWTVTFGDLRVEPGFTWHPLAPAEARARLGLLGLGGNRDQALSLFEAALAEDPGCAPAHFGLGLAAALDPRRGDPSGHFHLAAQGEPGNGTYHYFAGMALRTGPPGADAAARARVHLRRALQLGGPRADAVLALAQLALGPGPDPDGDLALVEESLRGLPGPSALRLHLGELYLRGGHGARGRALLEEVAAQTADANLASAAAGQLEAFDEKEADRLADAGMAAFRAKRYGEAVARMEEALGRARRASQRQTFQDRLREMKILIDLRTKAAGARKGRDRAD